MKHPMQPIVKDKTGTRRFLGNSIVVALFEFSRAKGLDMNTISTIPFSEDDRMQFAQLIGYSVEGFCELSYVSEEYQAELLKPCANNEVKP